ncbi:MAG TPA: dephospho-CoA kinase [Anaerolineales bacterium]|nr:dephospho-CoA kinase [Anaerolineales bacterium]
MARWPDHYVIALTGNIGTGKSVVRKMLEHLGAFTIDADALAHRVIAPGGPGYNAVTRTFGEWVVGPDGQINRQRLGRIVFSDPEALAKLESIIHPYVRQAVDLLINRSPARLAVIEAIKIIETGLARECDALWVVHAPAALQARRLVEKRKLSPAEAQQRIAAQNPQTEKLKSADVVIDNSGGFEETWAQVQAAVSKLGLAAATPAPAPTVTATPAGALAVRRARPGDATTIAALIAQATNNSRRLQRADVIAAFGDKAFMLAEAAGRPAALAGFKVENLVARVDELYFLTAAPLATAARPLLEAVEQSARELQCEAALVFVTPAQAEAATAALGPSGYAPATPESLRVDAWRDAARESMPAGSTLLFKKLREDRVLRPV